MMMDVRMIPNEQNITQLLHACATQLENALQNNPTSVILRLYGNYFGDGLDLLMEKECALASSHPSMDELIQSLRRLLCRIAIFAYEEKTDYHIYASTLFHNAFIRHQWGDLSEEEWNHWRHCCSHCYEEDDLGGIYVDLDMEYQLNGYLKQLNDAYERFVGAGPEAYWLGDAIRRVYHCFRIEVPTLILHKEIINLFCYFYIHHCATGVQTQLVSSQTPVGA